MTDIQDSDLERIVPAFYARVCEDTLIGPIFDDTVKDWDRHHARLIDFWSSVMRTSGRYKGNPVAAHVALKDRIEPARFTRWLALWRSVTDELVPGAKAVSLQEKAERIGHSLQLALWFQLPDADPGAET